MFGRLTSCFLTAAVLLMLLSGCKNAGNDNLKETETATEFSNKITFSINRIDGEKAGDDPIYNFISKKFNVDIRYIPVTWDNWIEKSNIFIASGELPDVLWWDLRPQQYAKYSEWCKDGVFKEIPGLDEKYKNLSHNIELMPVNENFKVDGKSYMIPHYTGEPEMKGMNGVSYYYRKDWAKAVGMDKEVFSYEDFKKYIRLCIEKDPGGNGSGNTLGVVGPTWTVPDHVFMLEGSPYFASFVKKDGKYVWGAALPETLEGIKISRELYDQGIINRDFYTVNDMDGEAQFLTGKAAVVVGSVDEIQLKNMRDHFAENNPDINADEAVMPMKVLGPHGKTLITEDYGFWSVSSFNPDIDDEKLDRILSIMDWCCTDEAGEIRNYGIKGKDWDMVDGKVKLNWETTQSGLVKKPYYLDYAHIYLNLGTNGGGQYGFSKNQLYSQELKNDILDWVEWRQSADQSIQKLDPELDFLVTPLKSKYGSYYSEVKNEIKRIIIDSNDIEKDWNAWLESMKPKVDPILEEINTELN